MALSITFLEKGKNANTKYLEDFLKEDPKTLAKYLGAYSDKLYEKYAVDPTIRDFIEKIDDSAYTGKEDTQNFQDPEIILDQIRLLQSLEHSKLDHILDEVFGKQYDEKILLDRLKSAKFHLKKSLDKIDKVIKDCKGIKGSPLSQTLDKFDDFEIPVSAALGDIRNAKNYASCGEEDHLSRFLKILKDVEKYLEDAKKRKVKVKFAWA